MPRGIPKAKNPPMPDPFAQAKIEGWDPTPDMGKIQPPPPEVKKCAECDHEKQMHYGGEKGWCNVGGCKCQSFK